MSDRNIVNWRGPETAQSFLTPFSSLRREMDRLFDDFLGEGNGRLFGGRGLQPDIEIQETDSAYRVTAELPGIKQKDIQVDLKDNVLCIAGEKRQARDENERGRHYSERCYGSFERRIPLTDEVDADKVEARFANGVLNITLPKNPKAREKGRHIEVKS